jgi:hypothetical protein
MSISHIRLSEFGLLHITWSPPIASIFLQTKWFHFSVWNNETLLYTYCIFLIHITWYFFLFFLIHSSVVGHLGFHSLVIVNTAANSSISLGVKLLDHMADLFLVSWGASILFSIVVVLIYIPTNSVWGFLFPQSSPNICCYLCSWW